MKLWISKNTDVPIRDQLVTQIALAISSGDIPVGERLPSRGELARRFGIHENTVSGAYQALAEKGLIEFHRGSGFFAKHFDESIEVSDLEVLTARYINDAVELGANKIEIDRIFREQLNLNASARFTVVEPDDHLREILVFEIRMITGLPVVGIIPDELESAEKTGTSFVALVDEKQGIEGRVPKCTYLKSRSIPEAMAGRKRPEADELIALVSGWEGFLRMAHTILLAAQIDPETVMIRSTAEKGWEKGLAAASMVISDSLSAQKFRGDPRLRVFPIISDESVLTLKEIVAAEKPKTGSV